MLTELDAFFTTNYTDYPLGTMLIDSQSRNEGAVRDNLSVKSVTRYSPVMNVYSVSVGLSVEANRKNANVTYMDELCSTAIQGIEKFVEQSGKYNFVDGGHPSYSSSTREEFKWVNEVSFQIYISII
jgi:hypothetical protein